MDAGNGDQLHQTGDWLSHLVGPGGGYLWMVALSLALQGGTAKGAFSPPPNLCA